MVVKTIFSCECETNLLALPLPYQSSRLYDSDTGDTFLYSSFYYNIYVMRMLCAILLDVIFSMLQL